MVRSFCRRLSDKLMAADFPSASYAGESTYHYFFVKNIILFK